MKHNINISVTSTQLFGNSTERFFDFYLIDSSGKSSETIKAPKNAKEIETMIVKVIEFVESLYEADCPTLSPSATTNVPVIKS